MLKKIFQKTHQSILMVQILQTITFFDTKKHVDWHYDHKINKNLDFWTSQVIEPQKRVFLAIFMHEITLYAIDIHKNRFITPFLTLKNHFGKRTSIRPRIVQHPRPCRKSWLSDRMPTKLSPGRILIARWRKLLSNPFLLISTKEFLEGGSIKCASLSEIH